MKILLFFLSVLLTLNGYAQTFTLNNGVVTADYWGPDSDITSELDGAIEYARVNKGVSIQLPNGNFRRTTTIVFKSSINLLGTGTHTNPTTRIGFPAKVKCVMIPYRGQDGFIMYSSMSNIELYQDAADDYGDSSAHGVHARSHVSLNNVLVSYASGNGFQIEGCQISGHPLEGQTDFSEIINCQAYNVNNGLYINGCDANKINVYKFNAVRCNRWGIYDGGMLGNFYTSPHFAFCGSGRESDVVVRYNEQHYAAISPENVINIGFRPDLFPQYWEKVEPMGNGPQWQPTKRYWSGGTYNIADVNAKTTMLDPYSESFQPNARQQQGTLSINGIRGSDIKGTGVDLGVYQGVASLRGSFEVSGFEKYVNINSPDVDAGKNAALGIRSFSQITPNVFHESESKTVFNKFKNSHNAKGFFEYFEDRFQLYPNGVLSFEATPTGVYLPKVSTSTSTKALVRNADGSIGERDFPVGAGGNGVSQNAFDALETKCNALQTKVNSLDAILATKASKEEVAAVSALVQALTVRVNALPTGNQPNPQLTQILSELQSIITRLNAINN